LQPVVLVEGLLKRVELAILGEALNGTKFCAVGLHRQHNTGTNGLTVEENRTGAADAVLAPDMGASEPQILAQKIN
jgi:hypothetical protein